MPLFQAFQDLKGLTSNINPLNLFSTEQQPSPSTTNVGSTPSTSTSASATPVPTPRQSVGGAVAGPGPSSAAALEKRTPRSSALNPSLGQPVSSSRPTNQTPSPRPSLKHSNTSASSYNRMSSSDSSDSITSGQTNVRKSSGASVSIADPEVTGEIRRKDPTRPRNRRPTSAGSGLTASSGVSGVEAAESRRRRKNPLDTYIIVRPPPTAAKNPLNLQIQLVVRPNRRGRDRSASAFSLQSDSTAMDTASVSNSTPVSPNKQVIDLPTDSSTDEDQKTTPPPTITTFPGSPASASAESDNGTGLKRSNSLRSSISTSTSATGSSTASGKRIEPMFNLAVHNVMQPTVVTDAATDVKVAKFHKRSLDISGVGALEPAEVWLPSAHTNTLVAVQSHLASEDGHGAVGRRSRPVSIMSLTTPLSPTITRSDDGKSGFRASLDLKGFKFENLRVGNKSEPHESNTRKFFGKVFKRKNSSGELSVPKPRKSSPSASFSSHEVAPTVHPIGTDTLHPNAAVKHSAGSMHGSVTEQHVVGQSYLGQPTFGTAPLVVARRSSGALVSPEGAITGLSTPSETAKLLPMTSSATDSFQSLPMIPSTRPVGYTWTVKKWAKKNTEGWAAHLVAAASAGLELAGGGMGGEDEDEVVFEWVKLRVPSNAAGANIMRRLSTTGVISGSRTRSKSRATSIAPPPIQTQFTNENGGGSPGQSRTSLTLQLPRRSASPMGGPGSRSPSTNVSPRGSPRLDGRPEPIRRISASISPSRRTSAATIDLSDSASLAGLGMGELTAEEEEDSDPEDSETPWTCSVWVKKTGQRQLLGTLTPAPHHPKVIGILKIPMALDSVSLTEIAAGNNVEGKEHLARKVKEAIALTEENLKDVVCVTAMWLVAREEFGGLGRKKSSRG
ncbi:hypothetical protein CI109_106505 [Kwoniella shandongensis]|uniref:Uncharacterized protein n=1 Tax=Kwoniella shandongensis TaxID=1734106 RepID=A0A5M6C2R4_9TREE|nr:uncharacterized protein CI109_002687 [Kwoniella shandongensis]KAA5528930.1 hypothetical protein CI109_002687 [Kwoniella shandongensis]